VQEVFPVGVIDLELHVVLCRLNLALIRWGQRKFKRFRAHKRCAARWLGRIARQEQEISFFRLAEEKRRLAWAEEPLQFAVKDEVKPVGSFAFC
jgi:hypothetical protein